jgi:acetyltransferase-like isoleucine patch superfamily enzyme
MKMLKSFFENNNIFNVIRKITWFLRASFFKIYFGRIGRYTYIGNPLIIEGAKNIYIGNFVRIYPLLRAEVYGKGKIVINDNVSIGHNLHLAAFEDLIIGENSTISSNVFIGSLDHSYEQIDSHIMSQELKGRKTEIGKNCFVGTGAVILSGTILGKQCIVAANSVVRGEFPDYCVIGGMPAKILKQLK